MGMLLIATVDENSDPVIIGIREFPVRKLVLVCRKEHLSITREIKEKVSILKIDVDTKVLSGMDLMMDFLRIVSEIIAENSHKYDDIYLNVGGGDRQMHCAAISAAFVNGIKAFDIMGDMIVPLPVLKFSYKAVISKAKLSILKALKDLGGEAKSLTDLSHASGVEKSLLSYHINGGRDSKGLVELGLLEVSRIKRGTLRIMLTSMGQLMLIGR